MGMKMVSKVWPILDVHSTEKWVLLTLAYHGDDNTGNSWISAGEIATLTNLSERQVFRVLKALKGRQLITNAAGVFGKSLWHLTVLMDAKEQAEPV